MNVKELVKFLNMKRLENKNKWFSMDVVIEGFHIRYKAFNTSIQILDINGVRHNSTMDIKVSEFKNHIENALEYARKNQ